jgi:hypothetical protein
MKYYVSTVDYGTKLIRSKLVAEAYIAFLFTIGTEYYVVSKRA